MRTVTPRGQDVRQGQTVGEIPDTFLFEAGPARQVEKEDLSTARQLGFRRVKKREGSQTRNSTLKEPAKRSPAQLNHSLRHCRIWTLYS
jgi:hypothetical protein